MQQIVLIIGSAVLLLGLVLYILLLWLTRREDRGFEQYSKVMGIDNADEYMRNLAYNHNASIKNRCSKSLFGHHRKCIINLRRYHYLLRDIPERLISLVPAAQWLVDNYYVINREVRVIRENFNRRYCKRTPVLKGGPLSGYPRIYSIAREILRVTDFHCDEDDIIRYLNEYQSVKPLTVAELWAFPNALKLNLIESINAISGDIMESIKIKQKVDRVIDEITSKGFSGTEEFIDKLNQKLGREDITNPNYIAHILYQLKELDIDDSLFKQWAVDKQSNEDVEISDIIRMESQHQASMQVNMSSAFTSLIEISAVDWEGVFERVSVIEKTLQQDPAGVYGKMDFSTKDLYHHEVEAIARETNTEEVEVARKAVELCKTFAKQGKRYVYSHVGFYLAGRGNNMLRKSISYSPGVMGRLRDWLREHKGAPYFFGVFLLTLLITAAGILYSAERMENASPAVIALSAFFILILAVTASVEVTNYFATRFTKTKKLPSMDFEEGIPDEYRTVVVMPVLLTKASQVQECTEKLETYYLANRDENLYIALLGDLKDANSRELSEDREILEQSIELVNSLNRKYKDENGNGPFLFLNRERLWNEKQGCWMGWERKRGKLEEFNRLIAGEDNTSFNTIAGNADIITTFRYVLTIDADTELTKGSASRLAGIMAHPLNRPVLNRKDNTVIDGYTLLQPHVGVRMHSALATLFSTVFAGQAGVDPYIYAVSDVYQDNFTEGIFAGKGIYDAKVFRKVLDKRFPDNAVLSHDLLEGSLVRCGLASDVELMDGFPSTVASFFKREHRWIRGDWQLLPWLFGRDSLNALSRWKMLDNLRRSLIPVAQLVFVFMALSVLNWEFVYWAPLVLFSMIFSLLVNIGRTTILRFKHNETGTFVSNILGSLAVTAAQGILLFIMIPYRAYISLDAVLRTLYRLLVSNRRLLEWTTAEASEKGTENSMYSYIRRMWICPASGIALLSITAGSVFSVITALLWFSGPLAAYYASRPREKKKKTLGPEKTQDLRVIARKTWRYFEEFFIERENWLTPDNYQVSPGNMTAQRSSPTNMGFQLLSTLSARDFGFIGIVDTVDRIQKVFDTIEKLEKWNGHLYNWYNTRNLEVLNPRYISSVDSGNFLSYLIALKTGLEQVQYQPVFPGCIQQGIKVTAQLANISISDTQPSELNEWEDYITDLCKQLEQPPREWMSQEWLRLFDSQCKSYLNDIKTLELKDINVTLSELYAQGVKGAENLVNRINGLIGAIDKLLFNMDFGALYDKKRNLFRVGFNISANSPDNSYYDLFASESRLTSFIAIAKGDVPLKHWFKLGRPLTLVHGAATLISWSGTMFEYLLPNVVLQQVPNTILRQTVRNSVKRQIEYARSRRVPWGISESGYYRFDINLNYQYRAFGIPDLGFRSDLRKSLVVSPYSTLLALPDFPDRAYRNIQHLRRLGAEGKYGFYEAIDFMSPNVQKEQKKYKLIQSYMIHHQGMILVSLNNYLNNKVMVRRFHADPLVKGVEVILEECKPHGVIIKKDQEKPVPLKPYQAERKGYETRMVQTTRPKYPVAHILSNNRYTTVFTSNGTGFSTWNNMAVNRWRQVQNKECYGMFFYIRDTMSKKYWSASFQPAMVEPDEYMVTFFPDRVEYRRTDGHIETKTEITLSPQEDVEVRRITLTNRSTHMAKMEITSYFEPVLDSLESDLAHPAFSKLFVATEYIEQNNILLANRRPRKPDDQRVWLFNTVTLKGRLTGPIEFETDRNRFIGRGNTLRNPHALETDLPLSNTAGSVLDPVMSMRANLSLLPGRSAVVTFITGIAHSREKAMEMGNRYRKDYSIEDIFKMALFDSEIEMQYLGLTAKQVNAIQDLVGSIYYPSRLMRGPLDAIEKNRLGQPGLWKFGLSGDLPVMMYRISSEQQINSLKDILSAYEYLRKNGVKLDFVILNEEKDDYFQPLNQKISDLISSRKIYYPNTKDARIYLLRARHLEKDEINLLLTVSRIVLTDKNRLMSRRIRKQLMEEADLPSGNFSSDEAKIYDDIPFENEELQFFNGLGGFTYDGQEYVVMLTREQQTPAPWANVIASRDFGFIATTSGGGYTWAVNSRENKISRWSNDPVTDPPSETVYIRDNSTGELFCPTPAPIREREPYRIRHGRGYSIFEHNSRGIKQKMLVYVGERDPVKIFRIELENMSGENREFSLFLYIELVLGFSREKTAPYIITEMKNEANMFTARNVYNSEYPDRITFVSSSELITSCTGDNSEFIGRSGHPDRPQGLLNEELSNRTGASLEPCAAVKVDIDLEGDEKKEIVFVLGQCSDEETAVVLTETYTRLQVAKLVLSRRKKYWRNITESIRVNTPDPAMNSILNGWMLYQVLSCRIMARTAFYQSGGAFGFRDQLQDCLALLHAQPEVAREQIIRCCARQFVEGDVQHWWHEDSGKGVRTRISDDMLWLPYAVAEYIKVTEDMSILDENTHFLKAELLKPGENEKFLVPIVSDENADVYEHCIRAIEKGMTSGEHGLPLMGSGDWNDGMNRVGYRGKGESIWLAWFMYKVLAGFIQVCRQRGDTEREEYCRKRADQIAAAVEKHAWDGEWYLRAFFDSGESLGSRHNNECRIDSISQSWSVLSGAGSRERVLKAMNSVYRYLVQEEDRLIMLLTPPFDKSEPDPGYIRGYLPGIRENGGQYTHAAVWAVIAFAEMDSGDIAFKLFNMLNPVTHTENYSDLMKYKQEPYVTCGDVYSRFPHAGRGGWSWYTGSAGWMYRAGIEWILGIRKRGKRLYINPVIPAHWRHFSFSYVYENTTYMVEVENPQQVCSGNVSLMLDGRELDEEFLTMKEEDGYHNVMVTIHGPGT